MNISFAQSTNVKTGLWSDVTVWANNAIPTDTSNIVLNYDITVDINAFCKSLNTNGHNVIVNTGVILTISGLNNVIDSKLAKTIFISGSDTLYSFNAQTGWLNWKKYLGSNIFSPVYANGNLYGINKPGTKILCYDTLGNFKWQINSSAGYYNRKLIPYNNSIFIADTSGVYSYNGLNGALQWQFLISASSNTISIDSNTLYLCSVAEQSGGGLFAINPATGDIKWNNTSSIASSFKYWNGRLYTIESYNIFGYKATNGELDWVISDVYGGSMTFAYNNLYMFSQSSFLVALNISTKETKWSVSITSARPRAPIVQDSVLYFATLSEIFKYNPFTGQQKGYSIAAEGKITGNLSVVDNTIFVATQNNEEMAPWIIYYGSLTAFDAETGQSGMPKWRSIQKGNFEGPPCVLTQGGKVYIGDDVY